MSIKMSVSRRKQEEKKLKLLMFVSGEVLETEYAENVTIENNPSPLFLEVFDFTSTQWLARVN